MNAGRELEREISRVTAGSHLCLVYESVEEQLAAVVPFIKAGLARGERCVYIADDRSVAEIHLALSQAGVDVARELSRGALSILTKREAYLRSGTFDPDAMIAFLRASMEQAVADGFTGLCATGEMTWALGPEIGNERLIEYENLLNQFFPGSRAHAVCQYNRHRFRPDIIRDVLRTHPVAVVGGLVCPNVFYEPPDMLLGRRSIAEEATWRIEQLKSARATARALERAEEAQRLLADATSILVSSLEHRTTLSALARLVVPQLADWCVFDLPTEEGTIGDPIAIAHCDPAKVERARAARANRSPRLDDACGVARVLRTGRTELLVEASGDGAGEALRGLEWTSALIAPLLVRDEPIGAITLAMDEPGRRFADEDRAIAEELARRAAMAVDNSRLFRQAHEAIAARDDFLALASHELRTPLTTLELQVDILDQEARAGTVDRDPSRLRAQIERLRRQTRRLDHIVTEVLDVSRIITGRLSITPEELDLSRIVAGVLDDLDHQATPARCEVRRDLEPGITGRWDRARLGQVVSALVSNALKYGAGSPVSISTRARGGVAEIVVADRGIGIAPADQARVFGKFERAVSPLRYGGLGLGLFVAKHLVEAMGGSIGLDSALGRGATFTVTLPRACPPPPGA
ncbi:MAG: MEDS domain-containing protein [Polyangiaceae bacterium]|nr:MEDS domain-containing protein [Polyangiaceae bacterium]